MNICLVYELNNREFNNNVLLERALVKRGHKVVMKHKTESLNFFKSYDVTVIPNSYRSSDVDFYRYVFNTKNNRIVVYPCEQVVNHKLPNFFDYSEKNAVKGLPHLCWGEDYFNWIRSLGFNNPLSRITGALQLDLCRKEFRSVYKTKKDLSNIYDIPLQKKWILFISDFVMMNEARVEFFIKAGAGSRESYAKKRGFEEKTSEAILSWFEKFLSDHPDYVLIYRKHPVEILSDDIIDFSKKNNSQIRLISDLSIKEWLFNCDFITTWNSTSLIECFAGDVQVGLLRPYSFTEEPEMTEYSFYKHYAALGTYDELEMFLCGKPVDYDEKTIEEINKLYNISDTPAFIRIAKAIEEIEREPHHECIKYDTFTYFFSRLLFMMKNHICLKVFLKNVYKFLYGTFGLKISGSESKTIAIKEWMLSVDNKKHKKTLSRAIDNVLNQYYE